MRYLFILLLSASLLGCVSSPKTHLPPSPPSTIADEKTWEQHEHAVLGLKSWQAQGRIAANRGHKGGNAKFTWRQEGEHFNIRLFGPFGAGAIQISGLPGQIELREANGRITRAESAELLLEKIAKWTVPITGLQFWLRGIPIPSLAFESQQLNPQGRLAMLQQNGWLIEYQDYLASHPVPLPHRLSLQNQSAKIKMVVTNWEHLSQ